MTDVIVALIFVVLFLLAGGFYLARVALHPRVNQPEVILRKEIESGRLIEADYAGWRKEALTINSPDGYTLSAVYFPLDGAHKTVVMSHGITMNYYQMLQFLPFFHGHGFNVLTYDLRNHGSSGGRNTTFGFYEKHDLKAVVDWAFDQLPPGGRVGTMGVSLGASTTLLHAALDPRLSFVIADCPYSELFDLFKIRVRDDFHLHHIPLLYVANGVFWLLSGARFGDISPRTAVTQFDTPLLLIHGEHDTYIPPEMSQELYERKTRGLRRLWIAPGAAHALSFHSHREAYTRQLETFLEEIKLN